MKRFLYAGAFEYSVKETSGNVDGVIYSTAQYTLRVYVANKNDDTLYVKNITADDGTGKKEKVLFTNTYVNNKASLIIRKRQQVTWQIKQKTLTLLLHLQNQQLQTKLHSLVKLVRRW